MYLNLLSEKNKVLFLELAHHVSKADGVLCKNEILILEKYKQECLLVDYKYRDLDHLNVLNTLNKETQTVKKIILFELIGLCMSDGEFCDDEKDLLISILELFSLEKNILDNFVAKINELNKIYEVTTGIILS